MGSTAKRLVSTLARRRWLGYFSIVALVVLAVSAGGIVPFPPWPKAEMSAVSLSSAEAGTDGPQASLGGYAVMPADAISPSRDIANEVNSLSLHEHNLRSNSENPPPSGASVAALQPRAPASNALGKAAEGVLASQGAAAVAPASPSQESRGSLRLWAVVSSPELAIAMKAEGSSGAGERATEPFVYVVQEGDSINAIAEKFGISAETIIWANDLDSPELISVGQELVVLPVTGLLHTVKEGDSLIAIANRYKTDVEAIVKANRLGTPDVLTVGQQLVIPGGRKPPPVVYVAQKPSQSPAAEEPSSDGEAAEVEAASEADSVGRQIVAVAMEYQGYAYSWGGHSPRIGFDCTGFVWYVYQQMGIDLPIHDLWGQLNAGPRIPIKELQPGDLVFFENTYKPGLSHNGIYIGGGRFIHAASERLGVIVSSLWEDYWASRYFGANRPW